MTPQNGISWSLIQKILITSPRNHLDLYPQPCSWSFLFICVVWVFRVLRSVIISFKRPLKGALLYWNSIFLTVTKFLPPSSSSYFFSCQFVFSVRESIIGRNSLVFFCKWSNNLLWDSILILTSCTSSLGSLCLNSYRLICCDTSRFWRNSVRMKSSITWWACNIPQRYFPTMNWG